MIEFLNELDTNLFLFLNGLNHHLVDPVMVVISAKMTWVPLYAVIMGLLIYYFRYRAWIWVAAALLTLAFTDLGSVHLFKNVFERLRPCHEPLLQELVHIVNNRCGGQYGFISSHAANTFGFASLMARAFKHRIPWLGYALYGWAGVVSYSRIYLGVHYPADIIVGAMWGIAGGWIIWWLATKSQTLFR